MDLASRVEGILFFKSEPMTISALARITGSQETEITAALLMLEGALQSRGIVLVREAEKVTLMTSPQLAATLEEMRRDELKRDIGKAGAETLAIISYQECVTRAEIDYIRGVNSTFILRNLLVRGLIERVPHPHDQRSFAYRPTIALYAHLGITRKEELPNYEEIQDAIRSYAAETTNENATQIKEL